MLGSSKLKTMFQYHSWIWTISFWAKMLMYQKCRYWNDPSFCRLFLWIVNYLLKTRIGYKTQKHYEINDKNRKKARWILYSSSFFNSLMDKWWALATTTTAVELFLLGYPGSNRNMQEPETCALPFGYIPVLITRTRIELVTPPWEGGVLTIWPAGKINSNYYAWSGVRCQVLFTLKERFC